MIFVGSLSTCHDMGHWSCLVLKNYKINIIALCGGINPYTLTARLRPESLAHYETSSRLDPTIWSFAQGNKMGRSSRILVG